MEYVIVTLILLFLPVILDDTWDWTDLFKKEKKLTEEEEREKMFEEEWERMYGKDR